MASPAYLNRRGRPRSPRELADYECILFRGRNGRTSWNIRAAQHEEIVDVRGPINCDEIDFILRAAIAGAGIAALPPQLVHEAYARKQLELVLPGHVLGGSEMHVVLPSSAFVPTRVMLLRDHLVRELSAASDLSAKQCAGAHAHHAAVAAGAAHGRDAEGDPCAQTSSVHRAEGESATVPSAMLPVPS